MENKVKKSLEGVLNNLKNNIVSNSDMAAICEDIRMYRKYLTNKEKEELLQILIYVLDNMCKIKGSEKIWAKNNSEYFSGNMCGRDELCDKYKLKFNSCCFKLEDISQLAKDIAQNEEYYNNDFYLRNVEVTLRDDVKITKSLLKKEGYLLADKLEKIINN